MLVLRFNLYLIISGKSIHEGKNLATRTLIQNLINKSCGEIVFRTGMIQITEISTYADRFLLLIVGLLFWLLSTIFSLSYDEILGIDPRIVEHKIKTYPNAKPFRQRLHVVNPRKAPMIKVEIEKVLKAGFIYPIPLTEWVSNLVPVDKK